MFFPGTPNIFVTGDSVFMLFKCMRNNISIEKKIVLSTNLILKLFQLHIYENVFFPTKNWSFLVSAKHGSILKNGWISKERKMKRKIATQSEKTHCHF